ncbi:MAG: hypothetical protein IJ736_16635, partial [Firmicutes bacterium]|nr:hypothetical protein [Bacillota bacterium]
MKKTHRKKIAAAAVSALLVISYYVCYALIFFEMGNEIPIYAAILFFIVPLIFIIGIIYALIERIREIERGEEDDLD